MIYSFAIVAVVIAIFVVLFIKQRKRKSSDVRSHHTVLIDGFPIVHIPISLSRERAEQIANKLRYVYVKAWAQMIKIYKEDPGPMPIATIGSSLFDVDPAHPHVMWIMPGDKVFLRVQPSMYYWFVRELHNIFRYKMRGSQWIYETKDDDDMTDRDAVGVWIATRWRKED